MSGIENAAAGERGLRRSRSRIVLAGGGVAAVESLIALRDLLNGFVEIDVVAPTEDFVYRPLSVAEPLGLTQPRRFSFAQIAADHGARLHRGLLEAVNYEKSSVSIRGGPSLAYDVLLVAVGARPREWLGGALHFSGPDSVARLRTVVDRLDEGALGRIAFAAPAGLSWTLPLYELALLTAARAAERGRGDVELTIVTPEPEPLDVFGPAAVRHVRELCANRGIDLRTGVRALALQGGRLTLEHGVKLSVDAVVALPQLEGEVIAGLPRDDAGFIPVDQHGAVRGLPGVYAAGDGIAFPVKQGGLAAQQADAAAEAIAARLGAAIDPRPFRAKLRGQLLTGLSPTYLTSGVTDAGPPESKVAVNPLWWPPSKIAGRYLAPYLSDHVSVGRPDKLVDRPAVAPDVAPGAGSHHDEMRQLALDFAEADAAGGDYRSALRWLDTVEQLEGVLSPALAQKQSDWQRLAA